ARDRQSRRAARPLDSGAGDAPARDARAVRLRVDPGREQDHVQSGRDPALRVRGRGSRAVVRRRLRRDVAVERQLHAHVHPDALKAGGRGTRRGLPEVQPPRKGLAHAKPGLAIGGGVAVTGSNATQTQVAINLLNAAAGNVGKTVRFGPDSAYGKDTPHAEVAALARAMAGGEIEVLVLGPGVDPGVTLPSGLKFADALRK